MSRSIIHALPLACAPAVQYNIESSRTRGSWLDNPYITMEYILQTGYTSGVISAGFGAQGTLVPGAVPRPKRETGKLSAARSDVAHMRRGSSEPAKDATMIKNINR